MDDQQGSSNLLPVPCLVGYYVDCEGNVYSTRRGILRQLKMRKHYGRGKKKYYLRVKVNGINDLAHRVVASILIGRRLSNSEVVNHRDGDTANNKLTNLEVVTHLENVEHAVINNLYCSGSDWHEAREPSTTIP